ncbi:MAG TPA: glycosyltransferase [Roseimicrobium sp.]|nr:glycosyltransferase [Roseimicrobium sp.]
MKLSIIIPAFNEEKLLEATLHRVRQAAAILPGRGWDWELVVCDNNSTDSTPEIARRAGAVVIFEPVNQIARARNTGAGAATGDWLVFIDADSHPSPGLFSELVDVVNRGKTIAGGCTLTLDKGGILPRMLVRFWNVLSRVRGWAAGSFVYCSTEVFREIGGFSVELFAGEEIDLFERLRREARRRGGRIHILSRHPLVTSSRKMDLYTPAEHLRFFFRTLFTGGRTLKRREDCHTWYDGRR